MKLTELDIPTAAEVVHELEADSIRIARLPQEGIATSGERSETEHPPAVMFVTDQPRRTYVNPRAALALIVAMIMTLFLWVLIESSATGNSSGSHKAHVHLTPAQQRAAAAARARAAAIAKAKRDRGTDAQWGDTVLTPAATP